MWKLTTLLLLLMVMVFFGYLSAAVTLLYWEGKPDGSQSCYGLVSFAVGLFGFLVPGVVFWYVQERQFTLRALLIATTLIVLVLGSVALWTC